MSDAPRAICILVRALCAQASQGVLRAPPALGGSDVWPPRGPSAARPAGRPGASSQTACPWRPAAMSVMRHQFRLGGDDVGKLCRQGLGDALMVGLSGTWQQRGIGHLLGEDVLEGIGRRGHAVRCQRGTRPLAGAGAPAAASAREALQRPQAGRSARPSHDGGEVEDVFCGGRQAVDTGRQDGLDRLRYAPGCRLRAMLQDGVGEFLQKKRVPVGSARSRCTNGSGTWSLATMVCTIRRLSRGVRAGARAGSRTTCPARADDSPDDTSPAAAAARQRAGPRAPSARLLTWRQSNADPRRR